MRRFIQKMKIFSKLPNGFSRFASGGRYNKKKRQQVLRRIREAKEAAAAAAAEAAKENVVDEAKGTHEDALVTVYEGGIRKLFGIKIAAEFNLNSLCKISYKDGISNIIKCFENDPIFNDVKRTLIDGEILSGIRDEVIFLCCYCDDKAVYPLIDKVNLAMLGVKVGERFIVLEKGQRIDMMLGYLKSSGLGCCDVLVYEIAKKRPLKLEYITFSLEELRSDIESMFLISKSNIEDYRHCTCLQRAFACFVIPAALSDWMDGIGKLLDEGADGCILESYSLPPTVVAQWYWWVNNKDLFVAGISILRRNTMPSSGSGPHASPGSASGLGSSSASASVFGRRSYSASASGLRDCVPTLLSPLQCLPTLHCLPIPPPVCCVPVLPLHCLPIPPPVCSVPILHCLPIPPPQHCLSIPHCLPIPPPLHCLSIPHCFPIPPPPPPLHSLIPPPLHRLPIPPPLHRLPIPPPLHGLPIPPPLHRFPIPPPLHGLPIPPLHCLPIPPLHCLPIPPPP